MPEAAAYAGLSEPTVRERIEVIMRVLIGATTIAAWLVLCSAAGAAGGADSVRVAIEKLNPGVKVGSPRSTPVAGLYETMLDGVNGYVTADGRYFIVGDLYDVTNRRNLAEENRKSQRMAMLKEADAADAITFAPKRPQHTITVFTDVDCGYCRKLHDEIAQYNERGIAVRYLAYPRSGPGSDAWKKMEAVWCSKDHGAALTRAKRGESIERPPSCETKSIANHYSLGERLGVQGTPMLVLEDGSIIGGYVPAQQLAARLNQLGPTQAAVVTN